MPSDHRLSARAIELDRIIISTPVKVQGLSALIIDTRDLEITRRLRGYRRIIVGYREKKVMKVG